MFSFDFDEIERLQREGDWDQATRLLVRAAQRVQAAGAELLLICTNTMHRRAEDVQTAIDIPLVHIADATAQSLRELGIQRVGLLGTRYTMEQDFYRGRLASHGFDVRVPRGAAFDAVHRIIYEELVHGIIRSESRAVYLEVVDALARQGAEAIILGCTEIELLIKDRDADVPLLETTRIHAESAVDIALGPAHLPPAAPPVATPGPPPNAR
jgi:aspartate racemase